MDYLSNLKYSEGSKKKRKRVGRGPGSGHGKTATRGMNGQMSRSGAKHKAWFEGGQMPLQRRIPKFGFKSIFKVHFQTVNLYQLQKACDNRKITGDTVNTEVLYKAGLISSVNKPIKVLGYGEITAKLSIEAHAFSESAKQKIETVGGNIKTL